MWWWRSNIVVGFARSPHVWRLLGCPPVLWLWFTRPCYATFLLRRQLMTSIHVDVCMWNEPVPYNLTFVVGFGSSGWPPPRTANVPTWAVGICTGALRCQKTSEIFKVRHVVCKYILTHIRIHITGDVERL